MRQPQLARAVVIGEAVMDVVRQPNGDEARHPGGSPANVAFGLGRLGRPATLLTQLGGDDDAAAVRSRLASAHVDVRGGGRPLDRTSIAVATIDDGGSATYSFDFAWELPMTEVPGEPPVVHTGSLAATVSPGAQTVERLLEQARPNSIISYDPNIRPMLVGPVEQTRDQVEGIIRMSDVVKASDDDITWLAPGLSPVDVAWRWLDLGPAIVVITLGSNGSVTVTRDTTLRTPARAVTVVDTIGAGDSFMAGLLDGLWSQGLLGAASRDRLGEIDTARLGQVLDHATRVAAITVSRAGADPPRRAELVDADRGVVVRRSP